MGARPGWHEGPGSTLGPRRPALRPDPRSSRIWAYEAAQAGLAVIAFLGWASGAAPIPTPPSLFRLVVPFFVWAVAGVGVESRHEAIRAGHSGDQMAIDQCGLILLIPALLLSCGYAMVAGAVLPVIFWRTLRQPAHRLMHELSASVLKILAASLTATYFSVPEGVLGPRLFTAVLAAGATLMAVEVVTSMALMHLESDRIDLRPFLGSARMQSRFLGISSAFVLLYGFNPIFTLIALPLAALAYSEERIRHLATRRPDDDKTGLATSATLTDRLAEEIRRSSQLGEPLSLVVIDLDHFKSVNTRFGHLGGDQALAQVADILHHVRRRTDLAVRWGGDELVWLMPGCPRAAAAEAAEGLRLQIAQTMFTLSGQRVSLSVSIGVASWRPGMSAAELFERADQALYRSKEAGRNTTSVDGVAPPPR